ncbi:MAG: glycosyltransferase, partial [Nitrospinae bacterium]|nr:glycosyltransferase [Nitrospinota bacterium]
KVFETDWPGYGPQKNRALEKATGDWILSIDADERVPPELRSEIEQAVKSERYKGYQIPRSSYYCGQRIRHSGWWPDYTPRLLRQGSGKFSNSLVHERLEIQGPVGYLRNPMIHYSFDDFEDVLNKMNWFSTQGAKTLLGGQIIEFVESSWERFLGFYQDLYITGRIFGRPARIYAGRVQCRGDLLQVSQVASFAGEAIPKKIMPRISVIVSTYNRPDALEMVLRSLEAQTCKDFEVVVADDGSREDTRLMLDRFGSQSPLKLKHVWQEDEGFRAASIRNQAVAASQGEYLVFLDGDCMVFPDFLAEHARLKEPNRFTTGNRMLLSRSFTEIVLDRQLPLHQWTFSQWIRARLKGQTNRLLPLLRLPLGFLRKLTPRKWYGVKTCNLGTWRQDFLDVNGFDESYQGWGYEDSDLVIRIMNKGVFRLEGRFAIPVIHLWHPLNHSPSTEENLQRLQNVLKSNATRVDNGVHRHMSA